MSILCSLLAAIYLLQMVTGVNYYISSSSGSDSNSGSTPNEAWKTFDKVSGLSLLSGDTLKLKCGDIWNQQLYINNARGSNISPVIIGSYNDGYRPWINGMNLNITEVVVCINCSNIIFNYLEISGSDFGLSLRYTLTKSTVSNINISNNYFHDIRSGPYNASSGNWWGYSIVTTSTTNSVTMHNLIIEHNLANNSDGFYRNGNAQLLPSRPVNVSTHIYGNAITHNSYNVLYMEGNSVSDFIIESNVFLNDTPFQLFDYGTTDIIVGACNENCKIINNEFGNRGEYPDGPDGCSIDFETHAVGSKVIGNYIHHSYGAGIMVFGHRNTNTYNYNLTIDDNIFIQDGCWQTRGDHGAIAFMNPSSGNVTNNMFVRCINQSIPIYWDNGNISYLQNWTFTNNTIYNYTKGHVVNDPIVIVNKSNDNAIIVSAQCIDTNCMMRYTLDGSKPDIKSMQYINNETIKIYTATSIFFKAFLNDMIQSATVGGIFDPR